MMKRSYFQSSICTISVISHDFKFVNTRQHDTRITYASQHGSRLQPHECSEIFRTTRNPSCLRPSESPRILHTFFLSFSFLLPRITKSPNTSRIMHVGASGMMWIRVRVHAWIRACVFHVSSLVRARSSLLARARTSVWARRLAEI